MEADEGLDRFFTQEIKLDASRNDTAEWAKTYYDLLGRPYKVLYADGSTVQSFYNCNKTSGSHLNI